jgi:hypothetical protein
MQQEVDRLNAGQRDDFNTISREQLQRQCLTLKRQKEFLKQQAEKKETTENLDRRRWRAKLTVPKLGKGLKAPKYPEWVATLTNLEKANGIPSKEATQFWKEGLDNEAAGEAHECKSPAEVKEVAKKLYWTEADRKRSEVEFAGFRRIQGETILQTKKRYIFTLIRMGEKISEERKVEKFAEAFMEVTSIALALNKKKEKLQGSWDILLRILQSEIFKRAIEDDVKREEKIKEDSQLFQIKEIRRRAKAKQETCKIKIYNISDQEIEILKDTIIARIEERKYTKLEISIYKGKYPKME